MSKKLLLKILSIVVAVAVVFVAAVVIINNVGTTVVSLGSNKALPSDTVEIPLEIKKNHGMYIAQIGVEYNADNLSFVSYNNGEVFDMVSANDTDGKLWLIFEMNKEENTTKDGIMATLKFKAKMSADNGEYNLKLKDCEAIDKSDKDVKAEYNNGKITVK